jgi:hypothetical protein
VSSRIEVNAALDALTQLSGGQAQEPGWETETAVAQEANRKNFSPQQAIDAAQEFKRMKHDHPHDSRCSGNCTQWDGKTAICHSSFSQPTVQNNSHHVDDMQLQSPLSKESTKEQSAFPHGTKSSVTATKSAHSIKTWTSHRHVVMSKTGSTVRREPKKKPERKDHY